MRIMQERVRKKMTRKELASSLGIRWQRLAAIEKGEGKKPDLVLLASMELEGLDVPYILTGKKTLLKPEETMLLDNYRNSTSENQRILRDVGSAITKSRVNDDEDCA
jgi:transcriptional regulator with XRE-family HTH domain